MKNPLLQMKNPLSFFRRKFTPEVTLTDEEIAIAAVREKTENYKPKRGLMIQSTCNPIKDAKTEKYHAVRINYIPNLINH